MKHRYLAGVAVLALAAGLNAPARAQVSTSGDVTLDPTSNGTGTTTVGSSNIPGTLTVDGTTATTYATGFLDLAPFVPTVTTGTSYVYVQNGGVLTAGGISKIGIIVGDGGAGTFNQTSGGLVTSGLGSTNYPALPADGARADIIIGAQAGSTGIYNIGVTGQTAAPALQVFGDIVLGRDPAAASPPPSAANGTLNIAGDGTSISVNQYYGYDSNNGGNLQVGVNGIGAVTQTDQSWVYLDHNLVLGANAGSSGTYTLTATSTTANNGYNLDVGSDLNIGGMQTDIYGSNFQTTQTGGTGTFNLNSGDVLVAGNVNVGNNNGTGNLNVTGGTLTAGSGMNIGINDGTGSGGGTGTVTQTGGTVTVGTGAFTANLNVGVTNFTSADSTTGSYSITGSSTLTVNGNADFGYDPGGTGTLTIGNGTDSPTVNINATGHGNDGNLTIGDFGNGYLYINSGTLNVNSTFGGVPYGYIQIGMDGTGTVTQTGGQIFAYTVNLSATSGPGSSTYTMTGGSLMTAADLDVGGASSGTATFTQSNGSVSVGGDMNIGNSQNASYYLSQTGISSTLDVTGAINIGAVAGTTGTLSEEGGSVTAGSVSLGGVVGQSGDGGTGTVTQGAGTFTVTGDVNVGYASNGTGTYTLNGVGTALSIGGSLYIGELSGSNGTFNLDSYSTSDPATLTFTTPGTNLVVGDYGNGTLNIGLAGVSPTDLNLQASNTLLDVGRGLGGVGIVNIAVGSSLEDDAIVGDAGMGTVNNTGGAHTVTGDLTLGNQSTGNGTYNLTAGGTLNVSGFDFVGASGQGTFLNDASTDNTQILVVGRDKGSTGLYTLQNGGSLTVGTTGTTGFADIGEHGTGTFTQTDTSSSLIYGSLDVGRYIGGVGIVNLQGGTMEVAQGFAVVGDSGAGTFNQSGASTMTVDAGGLTIGRGQSNSGSDPITGKGTYNLSDTATLNVTGGISLGSLLGNTGTMNQTGGGVTTDIEYVGLEGIGDWNQSAGTNTTSSLVIGNNTGGKGTYELSGDPTLSVLNGGAEYVGAAGNGTLTQTGGTNNATSLTIANNAGGVGLYTLSAGTLNNSGLTFLGGDTGAQGTFNQTGGSATLSGYVFVGVVQGPVSTFSLGGTGSLSLGSGLDIGFLSGANGAFNFNTTPGDMATLAFTSPGSTLTVGDAGTGVFNQGGGNLDLFSAGVTLTLGVQSGSSGTYNLTGGTLEDDLIVGQQGTGVFNNSGGVHTVNGNLLVGDLAGGNGTYTLSGGGNLTLNTTGGQIILGDAVGATGTFNYNTPTLGAVTFGSGQSILVGNYGNGTFNQDGRRSEPLRRGRDARYRR